MPGARTGRNTSNGVAASRDGRFRLCVRSGFRDVTTHPGSERRRAPSPRYPTCKGRPQDARRAETMSRDDGAIAWGSSFNHFRRTREDLEKRRVMGSTGRATTCGMMGPARRFHEKRQPYADWAGAAAYFTKGDWAGPEIRREHAEFYDYIARIGPDPQLIR